MEVEILLLINDHDGQWGWYQLDRALSIRQVTREKNLMAVLKRLEQNGLIQSKQVEGSPQPRYWITTSGKKLLTDQEATSRALTPH